MTDSRKIIITGASRGLGASMVNHLLAQGHTILGVSRSETEFSHENYQHYTADVASEEDVDRVFKRIRKEHKQVDALINNAGIASMNAFALTPGSTIKRIMDINFAGTFMCSQKAIPLLRRAKHARIINMSTVAVPLDLEGEAAYAASKSAVESLTRVMSKELATFNITCNSIGPSPIETDLIKGVGEERIAKLVNRQGIKRMAQVEDVLNIMDFYLQPQSDMISGQILYLGGIA